MLSKLLTRFEKENNQELVALVKRLSPVAWRHINLFGRYEFNSDLSVPDLDKMIYNIKVYL